MEIERFISEIDSELGLMLTPADKVLMSAKIKEFTTAPTDENVLTDKQIDRISLDQSIVYDSGISNGEQDHKATSTFRMGYRKGMRDYRDKNYRKY